MARVTFVKAAAKAYPHADIKKGDSYYWWKNRYGPKHFSKTMPRPSQTCSSDKHSTVLAAHEGLEDNLAELRRQYLAEDPMETMCLCGFQPVEGMKEYRRIHGKDAKCLTCGKSLLPPKDWPEGEWLKVLKEAIESFAGDCEAATDEVNQVRDEYQEALDAWPNGNSQMEEHVEQAEGWASSFEEMSGKANDLAESVGTGESTMEQAMDELEEAVSCLELP